jgi:hypothetical protein
MKMLQIGRGISMKNQLKVLMPYSTCVFYEVPSISGFHRETGESKIRIDTLPLRRECNLGSVELITFLSVHSNPHDA